MGLAAVRGTGVRQKKFKDKSYPKQTQSGIGRTVASTSSNTTAVGAWE